MYNTKEFETFLKEFNDIKLSSSDKNRLKSIGKDEKLMEDIFNLVKNHIMNKAFTTNYSIDFLKGAIFTLGYLRGMFK